MSDGISCILHVSNLLRGTSDWVGIANEASDLCCRNRADKRPVPIVIRSSCVKGSSKGSCDGAKTAEGPGDCGSLVCWVKGTIHTSKLPNRSRWGGLPNDFAIDGMINRAKAASIEANSWDLTESCIDAGVQVQLADGRYPDWAVIPWELMACRGKLSTKSLSHGNGCTSHTSRVV